MQIVNSVNMCRSDIYYTDKFIQKITMNTNTKLIKYMKWIISEIRSCKWWKIQTFSQPYCTPADKILEISSGIMQTPQNIGDKNEFSFSKGYRRNKSVKFDPDVYNKCITLVQIKS